MYHDITVDIVVFGIGTTCSTDAAVHITLIIQNIIVLNLQGTCITLEETE